MYKLLDASEQTKLRSFILIILTISCSIERAKTAVVVYPEVLPSLLVIDFV